MKRRTEITIETETIVRVRRCSQATVQSWCLECAASVTMVTPDRASWLTGRTLRTIYRQVEDRVFHFREAPGGQLYICLNSIHSEVKSSPPVGTLPAERKV